MGAAALAGGCMTDGFSLCGAGGVMQGFAAPALKNVRAVNEYHEKTYEVMGFVI